MIIRCERCSTLYDLDEALLAPEGSPVQCAKCQAVFTATPPKPGASPGGQSTAAQAASPPAATTAGTSATPSSAASAFSSAGAASSPPPSPASPTGVPPAPASPSAAAPRATRTGPNIYRPPQPPPAPPPARGRARAGAPPRDAVTAMDARLRAMARWKLAIIPAALALVALLAWGGWSAWKRRPDPETQRQRAEAMALIAQDDAASLGRATDLLDAIQQGDRPSSGAAGERGLARALLAAALADEVEPLAERQAAAAAEKARLEREQPPGFEDALRALAMEATRAEVELAPRRKKLEALVAHAADELKALGADPRGAREAARGQAILAVLAEDAGEVERAVTLLRKPGQDPWADLAELWLAVRQDGAARDRAIPGLVTLAATHPELIRARFVLARALLVAGRREEAISVVARLLSANPHHERAQRLRTQLAVKPPPPPPPVAPEPPRPAWTPRAAPPPGPAAVNVLVAPVVVPPAAAGNLPPATTPAVQPASPAPVEVPLPPPPQPAPKPRPPLPEVETPAG